jgi:DNA-binding LacI/PurR family transcriptional regulator
MKQLPPRLSVVAQIAAFLKEGIKSHEWDKWLPSERELCGQLQVARMTLRAALKLLQNQGWIRTSPGKRTRIVARPRRPRSVVGDRVLLLTPVAMESLRPFTILCISELRELLAQAGYHLEHHPTHALSGQGSVQVLESLLRQLRPAGCVLAASTHKLQEWFSGHRVPCVIVGSGHPAVDLSTVDIAYRAVCRHAVGQFLARGRRRLTFLNLSLDAAGDLESEHGFNEAVAQASLPGVEATIVRHDGTIPTICRKLDLMLRQQNPPTALLISRPGHVLTVMGHLLRRGLRVPQDMALISRDFDPFLAEMVPGVARYVASPGLMARHVSRVVLKMAQDGWVKPRKYLIMPDFVEGETLGRTTLASVAAGK